MADAAAAARGRCHCGQVRFVARFPFDDPVDRPPGGHAFAEEHVAWLPFDVPRT